MDPSLISALSAVMGSIVGGSASLATALFTQRAQSRREMVNSEIRRRETIYTEFIAECSKLGIDALDNSLDRPGVLVQAYALQNRIRLSSSDEVVKASEQTLERIIDQYFQPNLTIEQIRSARDPSHADPLRIFSEACREELRQLLRGY